MPITTDINTFITRAGGNPEPQPTIAELMNQLKKVKQQLDIANQYCEHWGYKWDEKEEVYVMEDDGLSDSEDE